jgi:hypothetical protein
MINGNLERKKDSICNIFDKLESFRIELVKEGSNRSPPKNKKYYENRRRSRSRSSSLK